MATFQSPVKGATFDSGTNIPRLARDVPLTSNSTVRSALEHFARSLTSMGQVTSKRGGRGSMPIPESPPVPILRARSRERNRQARGAVAAPSSTTGAAHPSENGARTHRYRLRPAIGAILMVSNRPSVTYRESRPRRPRNVLLLIDGREPPVWLRGDLEQESAEATVLPGTDYAVGI